MNYKLYSDGCYFREFNAAGIGGYLLDNNNNIVFEFSERLSDKTYYDAHERMALCRALEKCVELNLQNESIEYFSDDKALMQNLDLNCLSEDSILGQEIMILKNQFSNIGFSYIPRDENKLADKLSRREVEEQLFTKNQIVHNGYYHPRFISKNHYPKGETIDFFKEREHVNKYLVIHSYRNKEEDAISFDVYYAEKNGDSVNYELKESSNFIAKGWHKEAINNLVKHMNVLSDDTKEFCIVVHDEYIIFDQFLRGRKEVTEKLKSAFKNLDIVLDCLDRVFIHRDPLVYQEIFQDNPFKMLSREEKNKSKFSP